MIPIIAFSAWSGTGKTTIIEQLIAALKSKGLRLAVIKHDAHDFEIDKEGKDSWRFSQAGADMTIISSQKKTALIEQRSLELSEIIDMVHDVDLIILEGYNDLPSIPRIGIARKATGKGFRHPVSSYIALITDMSASEIQAGDISAKQTESTTISSSTVSASVNIELPKIFSLTDITGISDFIQTNLLTGR